MEGDGTRNEPIQESTYESATHEIRLRVEDQRHPAVNSQQPTVNSRTQPDSVLIALGHCVTVNNANARWETHAQEDVVPADASNEEIARCYAEVAYASVLDALQGARP